MKSKQVFVREYFCPNPVSESVEIHRLIDDGKSIHSVEDTIMEYIRDRSIEMPINTSFARYNNDQGDFTSQDDQKNLIRLRVRDKIFSGKENYERWVHIESLNELPTEDSLVKKLASEGFASR